MVAIMGWDGVTSYAGLRTTTNDIRLATGLLTGWALPLIVSPLVNSQMWTSSSNERVLDGWRDAAAWLLPLPVAFALVRWVMPLTGVLYPVVVAVCVIATFVSVNLVIATLIPRLERRAVSWIAAWPALLVGLALSVAEIGGTAWLRAWLQSLVPLR